MATSKKTPLIRVRKESVRTQIYEQLKAKILQRQWAPGTRLPSESDLSQVLGVSRVSVREGLQRLVSLGLLETRHGEGTFVKGYSASAYLNTLLPLLALSPTDILDVLEYRLIMEKGTAALVVAKAEDGDIRDLERTYASMVELKSDLAGFARADLEFHLILARISRNPILIKVNGIILDLLSASMESIVTALGTRDGLHYHQRIIEAVKERDAAKTEALIEEHIVRTIQRLRVEGVPDGP